MVKPNISSHHTGSHREKRKHAHPTDSWKSGSLIPEKAPRHPQTTQKPYDSCKHSGQNWGLPRGHVRSQGEPGSVGVLVTLDGRTPQKKGSQTKTEQLDHSKPCPSEEPGRDSL